MFLQILPNMALFIKLPLSYKKKYTIINKRFKDSNLVLKKCFVMWTGKGRKEGIFFIRLKLLNFKSQPNQSFIHY